MAARAYAEKWKMFPENGGKILCAVSGGGDSMCLLHWLLTLAGEGIAEKKEGSAGGGERQNSTAFTVVAAHYNHHLRGEESDGEERFVKRWCQAQGVPLFCGGGDVGAAAKENGWSVEEAGRRLRYAFLQETASACGAERIATAHNADDNAETLLMHLVRGTGLAGLGGIAPLRGRLIRPLLQTSHRDILRYLQERQIPHVEDSSNGDLRFARNRFRHEILPGLQRENPNFLAAVARQTELFRREDAFLDTLAAQRMSGVEQWEGGVRIARKALRDAPPVLRSRMVRLLLERLPVGKADYSSVHMESVARLGAEGTANGSVPLPKSILAVNRGKFLELLTVKAGAENVEIVPQKTVSWNGFSISAAISAEKPAQKMDMIQLNRNKIHAPLFVGSWRANARMTLPGAKGARSLKRLFSERGVLSPRREQTPVFYVGDEVAAVFGMGVSADFAAENDGQTLTLAVRREK